MCAVILCGCAKSQEQYSKEITDVVAEYNNGNISYDEATSELSSLYESADSELQAKIDEERVIHKKRPVVAPGEMEQVILQKSKLADYPDLKHITIKIEEA